MKVVLKHEGRWLQFSNPSKILRTDRLDDIMPMLHEADASGLYAAGFISYEAAPAFDAALCTRSATGFPLICLGLFAAPAVREDINELPAASFSVGELRASVSKDEFAAAIGAIKVQIAAGATYQVNYSYRLNAAFSGDTWAFFHALVNGQRAEHAAYIETDDFAVCSASPELFFSVNDGVIVSRPMKGTARRGRTFAEDWQQAEGLRNSEKDRAENIMIVDMVRNDIGRIAEPGSVEAVSTYDVEKYPTIWQMTSTVTGRINHEVTKNTKDSHEEGHEPSCVRGGSSVGLIRVLKALFPCASITGAPKAKTMEIIRDLETTPRNIYTGSIGFATPQGEACFNVAIRTALIDRIHGSLEYGVGGGIVWDSVADAEYEETLTKARVMTQPRPDFQLLETMLWEPDAGIFLLDRHMQRLGKSAACFDVPIDIFSIQTELDRLIAQFDAVPRRIRLLVSRDGSFEVQCTVQEQSRALSMKGPTIRVAVAKEPVDVQDVFLYHKTTHRIVYESAMAVQPDCEDVILWNERGEVTEGCVANIVIRQAGRLITPPVACGLLAGTFREHLIQSGEIEEGVITREQLKAADEVYLINSVRGWQPAQLEC